MTNKEVLQRLQEGNKRFVANKLDGQLNNASRRAELMNGQQPFAVILGCADSRVVPELVFDTGLGELFVIRVAGNVANPESIASIEYAIANLNTQLIVVLGHENCGAVTAAMQGGDNGVNLNLLLSQIQPAITESDKTADVNTVVKKNAQLVATDLFDRSSILANAINQKKLKIVPAFYNLESGKVDFL